ncbi:uncharacterized protein I303_105834 [Kwoniella dejecticola CBS 10117]|uniref:Uncharacterized protein n=1 Tax=Kwoniella dejecticola CBS 10117 TaxID=1296121 RepID=A0A1A6A0I4_9TREE|nr:uncharacterized protein I303_05855 [Kwoniella dejecticola CBS 10117]OBR83575.1 hypothetical protein I303_05855 [Kwoniella dejecticola CBS 10117]
MKSNPICPVPSKADIEPLLGLPHTALLKAINELVFLKGYQYVIARGGRPSKSDPSLILTCDHHGKKTRTKTGYFKSNCQHKIVFQPKSGSATQKVGDGSWEIDWAGSGSGQTSSGVGGVPGVPGVPGVSGVGEVPLEGFLGVLSPHNHPKKGLRPLKVDQEEEIRKSPWIKRPETSSTGKNEAQNSIEGDILENNKKSIDTPARTNRITALPVSQASTELSSPPSETSASLQHGKSGNSQADAIIIDPDSDDDDEHDPGQSYSLRHVLDVEGGGYHPFDRLSGEISDSSTVSESAKSAQAQIPQEYVAQEIISHPEACEEKEDSKTAENGAITGQDDVENNGDDENIAVEPMVMDLSQSALETKLGSSVMIDFNPNADLDENDTGKNLMEHKSEFAAVQAVKCEADEKENPNKEELERFRKANQDAESRLRAQEEELAALRSINIKLTGQLTSFQEHREQERNRLILEIDELVVELMVLDPEEDWDQTHEAVVREGKRKVEGLDTRDKKKAKVET